MADEKDPSQSTEVISTAATSKRGKVRWSSATGKLETAPPQPSSGSTTDVPEGSSSEAAKDPGAPDVPWGKTERPPVQDGNGSGELRAPAAKEDPATPDPAAAVETDPSTDVAPSEEPQQAQAAEADTSAETVAVKKRRPSMRARLKTVRNKATEIPILVFMAFAIAIVIKTFLVQAFYIPSTSMLPTLRTGDRVLVEKLSYRFTDPARGDVVVFEKSVFGVNKDADAPWYQDAQGFFRELLGLPTGTEEDYIKRIVAVSGDVVEYKGSPRQLFVNNEKVPQDFVYRGRDTGSPTLTSADCKRLEMQRAGSGCRVPAGRVFVMGDNRGNSEDSRILGPIEEDKIVGRAFVIIWPPSDFGGL